MVLEEAQHPEGLDEELEGARSRRPLPVEA